MNMEEKKLNFISENLSDYIHQAALDPHIKENTLNEICDACNFFKFAGLCTSLQVLPYVRKRISPSEKTSLIATISFPFGDLPSSIKLKSAEWAAMQGVDEFEVVPNFYALNQGKEDIFAEELARICELGLPVRVILDISNLQKESLALAIEASIDAGVFELQSGNGFGPPIEKSQVQELKKLARGRCGLKAVGGIKKLSQVIELIESGASKIGTSFGTQIMKEEKFWAK